MPAEVIPETEVILQEEAEPEVPEEEPAPEVPEEEEALSEDEQQQTRVFKAPKPAAVPTPSV